MEIYTNLFLFINSFLILSFTRQLSDIQLQKKTVILVLINVKKHTLSSE